MPRQIVGKGLRFSLRHAPCARICRYCLISESRKRSALPFSQFEELVHRFPGWKQSEGCDEIEIGDLAQSRADCGITIETIARQYGLGFSRYRPSTMI